MNQKQPYVIVRVPVIHGDCEKGFKALEEAVNQCSAEGFKPCGGVSSITSSQLSDDSTSSNILILAQSMIMDKT